MVIPGNYHNHDVTVYDLGTNINEPLRTIISHSDHTVQLEQTFSFFARDKVQLLGKPGSIANLSLHQLIPSKYNCLKVTASWTKQSVLETTEKVFSAEFACIQNYTVYFHSINFHCRNEQLCHIGWLFFIISELVPVTLIFITVLVLNISFTSGAVKVFITCSQLLLQWRHTVTRLNYTSDNWIHDYITSNLDPV